MAYDPISFFFELLFSFESCRLLTLSLSFRVYFLAQSCLFPASRLSRLSVLRPFLSARSRGKRANQGRQFGRATVDGSQNNRGIPGPPNVVPFGYVLVLLAVISGCFSKLCILFAGVLLVRALLFGVEIKAPFFGTSYLV